MDFQRQMLDQLMGVNRNQGLDGRRPRQFTDNDVRRRRRQGHKLV